MRDIRFKAKRISNGEWVYGDLIHHFNGDMEIRTWNHLDDVEYYEDIDPATVSQFSGLKDKNGKEIFEGDRLAHHIFGRCTVYFCDVQCAFEAKWDDKYEAIFSHVKHGEITGNIHDKK